ncbi:MAG: hypothetical protein VKK04_03155 [Synechococcales bacterium]|nr:hypothetical protein [Synechococcales bacterium]
MAYDRPNSSLDYRVLEGFQPAPAPSVGASLRSKLARLIPSASFWTNFWTAFINLAAGKREPIVEMRRDRQGNVFYTVYDPTTGQRTVCASEQEVRVWLEERYCR